MKSKRPMEEDFISKEDDSFALNTSPLADYLLNRHTTNINGSESDNLSIEDIKSQIEGNFYGVFECSIIDNKIVVKEDYEMEEDAKNSDDCYETARENGLIIIDFFPMLQISNYYCHRNKYAIVELELTPTED